MPSIRMLSLDLSEMEEKPGLRTAGLPGTFSSQSYVIFFNR
jgi:hypothetical protein